MNNDIPETNEKWIDIQIPTDSEIWKFVKKYF